MKRKNVVFRFWQWLGEHVEHVMAVVIVTAMFVFLYLAVFRDWGFYGGSAGDSHFSLLSTLAVGLLAVLAVLIVQPVLANRGLAAFWLLSTVSIYLAAIGWSLVVLAGLGSWISAQSGGDRVSASVALVLALAALAYLVPFKVADIKSLQPSRKAWLLIQRDDTAALDDLLRQAVNEGTMTTFSSVLTQYTERVKARLSSSKGVVAEAEARVKLYLSVGRHVCQHRSPDAVLAVMEQLTDLTAYCSAPPQLWRAAADVFNNAVKELYLCSVEWVWSAAGDRVGVDFARISLPAGDSFYEIAQVKAEGREDNLLLAIEAYGLALLFYTRQRFPVQHAGTQNNLGAAYRDLAEVRDKEANLGKAIAAYREALIVRTLAAFPVDYAMTQDKLGYAYSSLAEVRDKEANLERAIAAHQQALTVYDMLRFKEFKNRFRA